MFRLLAQTVAGGADALVVLHPMELAALLEAAWNNRINLIAQPEGHPDRRSAIAGMAIPNFGYVPGIVPPAVARFYPVALQPPTRWDHLIYAYMIENTAIYEIFQRVLHEFLHGERLGTLGVASQQWLRNTEELFFRDPPSFSISNITSHVRPDLRATRRNAYLRMFGMPLNHEKDHPYVRAEASNNEFVSTFDELLREVWVGMTNYANIAGQNPTDDGKIASLVTRLYEMLRSRRQYGTLSREEFAIVSMMSWFHLTVESDLPIIQDLRASAASPEQRLFKIAERVGLAAHGHSKSYFDIASPLSRVLTMIETSLLNVAGAVSTLYNPTVPAAPPPLVTLEPDMRTIITHWSIIRQSDMKARKVTPS